ncbi:L-rhamnose mutarotase [Spirosoma rhododendri]|uniref:L-rhamnose mutarotase n=1 Tax=Spirosoma rhododendri TaxID=2728024 RepID=A0A7L5DNV7_9BACT|nr:L-rhamnose mutarotase [Spirosoma rhododendri]QJD79242.1 L-rhamnose mutarotase [Spirosoma rhododendri]
MRYCLALDLKDDPALIAEYERQHVQIRPEIDASIRTSGINDMQIFRVGNRLFMIIETDENFSFDTKAAMDAANPAVQEWETFVSTFQQPLPFARPGEKWVLMKQIFAL